ncbi:MAG: hypothetical protein ACD_79C00116G0001, partial [uncultured bacterium]
RKTEIKYENGLEVSGEEYSFDESGNQVILRKYEVSVLDNGNWVKPSEFNNSLKVNAVTRKDFYSVNANGEIIGDKSLPQIQEIWKNNKKQSTEVFETQDNSQVTLHFYDTDGIETGSRIYESKRLDVVNGIYTVKNGELLNWLEENIIKSRKTDGTTIVESKRADGIRKIITFDNLIGKPVKIETEQKVFATDGKFRVITTISENIFSVNTDTNGYYLGQITKSYIKGQEAKLLFEGGEVRRDPANINHTQVRMIKNGSLEVVTFNAFGEIYKIETGKFLDKTGFNFQNDELYQETIIEESKNNNKVMSGKTYGLNQILISEFEALTDDSGFTTKTIKYPAQQKTEKEIWFNGIHLYTINEGFDDKGEKVIAKNITSYAYDLITGKKAKSSNYAVSPSKEINTSVNLFGNPSLSVALDKNNLLAESTIKEIGEGKTEVETKDLYESTTIITVFDAAGRAVEYREKKKLPNQMGSSIEVEFKTDIKYGWGKENGYVVFKQISSETNVTDAQGKKVQVKTKGEIKYLANGWTTIAEIEDGVKRSLTFNNLGKIEKIETGKFDDNNEIIKDDNYRIVKIKYDAMGIERKGEVSGKDSEHVVSTYEVYYLNGYKIVKSKSSSYTNENGLFEEKYYKDGVHVFSRITDQVVDAYNKTNKVTNQTFYFYDITGKVNASRTYNQSQMIQQKDGTFSVVKDQISKPITVTYITNRDTKTGEVELILIENKGRIFTDEKDIKNIRNAKWLSKDAVVKLQKYDSNGNLKGFTSWTKAPLRDGSYSEIAKDSEIFYGWVNLTGTDKQIYVQTGSVTYKKGNSNEVFSFSQKGSFTKNGTIRLDVYESTQGFIRAESLLSDVKTGNVNLNRYQNQGFVKNTRDFNGIGQLVRQETDVSGMDALIIPDVPNQNKLETLIEYDRLGNVKKTRSFAFVLHQGVFKRTEVESSGEVVEGRFTKTDKISNLKEVLSYSGEFLVSKEVGELVNKYYYDKDGNPISSTTFHGSEKVYEVTLSSVLINGIKYQSVKVKNLITLSEEIQFKRNGVTEFGYSNNTWTKNYFQGGRFIYGEAFHESKFVDGKKIQNGMESYTINFKEVSLEKEVVLGRLNTKDGMIISLKKVMRPIGKDNKTVNPSMTSRNFYIPGFSSMPYIMNEQTLQVNGSNNKVWEVRNELGRVIARFTGFINEKNEMVPVLIEIPEYNKTILSQAGVAFESKTYEYKNGFSIEDYKKPENQKYLRIHGRIKDLNTDGKIDSNDLLDDSNFNSRRGDKLSSKSVVYLYTGKRWIEPEGGKAKLIDTLSWEEEKEASGRYFVNSKVHSGEYNTKTQEFNRVFTEIHSFDQDELGAIGIAKESFTVILTPKDKPVRDADGKIISIMFDGVEVPFPDSKEFNSQIHGKYNDRFIAKSKRVQTLGKGLSVIEVYNYKNKLTHQLVKDADGNIVMKFEGGVNKDGVFERVGVEVPVYQKTSAGKLGQAAMSFFFKYKGELLDNYITQEQMTLLQKIHLDNYTLDAKIFTDPNKSIVKDFIRSARREDLTKQTDEYTHWFMYDNRTKTYWRELKDYEGNTNFKILGLINNAGIFNEILYEENEFTDPLSRKLGVAEKTRVYSKNDDGSINLVKTSFALGTMKDGRVSYQVKDERSSVVWQEVKDGRGRVVAKYKGYETTDGNFRPVTVEINNFFENEIDGIMGIGSESRTYLYIQGLNIEKYPVLKQAQLVKIEKSSVTADGQIAYEVIDFKYKLRSMEIKDGYGRLLAKFTGRLTGTVQNDKVVIPEADKYRFNKVEFSNYSNDINGYTYIADSAESYYSNPLLIEKYFSGKMGTFKEFKAAFAENNALSRSKLKGLFKVSAENKDYTLPVYEIERSPGYINNTTAIEKWIEVKDGLGNIFARFDLDRNGNPINITRPEYNTGRDSDFQRNRYLSAEDFVDFKPENFGKSTYNQFVSKLRADSQLSQMIGSSIFNEKDFNKQQDKLIEILNKILIEKNFADRIGEAKQIINQRLSERGANLSKEQKASDPIYVYYSKVLNELDTAYKKSSENPESNLLKVRLNRAILESLFPEINHEIRFLSGMSHSIAGFSDYNFGYELKSSQFESLKKFNDRSVVINLEALIKDNKPISYAGERQFSDDGSIVYYTNVNFKNGITYEEGMNISEQRIQELYNHPQKSDGHYQIGIGNENRHYLRNSKYFYGDPGNEGFDKEFFKLVENLNKEARVKLDQNLFALKKVNVPLGVAKSIAIIEEGSDLRRLLIFDHVETRFGVNYNVYRPIIDKDEFNLTYHAFGSNGWEFQENQYTVSLREGSRIARNYFQRGVSQFSTVVVADSKGQRVDEIAYKSYKTTRRVNGNPENAVLENRSEYRNNSTTIEVLTKANFIEPTIHEEGKVAFEQIDETDFRVNGEFKFRSQTRFDHQTNEILTDYKTGEGTSPVGAAISGIKEAFTPELNPDSDYEFAADLEKTIPEELSKEIKAKETHWFFRLLNEYGKNNAREIWGIIIGSLFFTSLMALWKSTLGLIKRRAKQNKIYTGDATIKDLIDKGFTEDEAIRILNVVKKGIFNKPSKFENLQLLVEEAARGLSPEEAQLLSEKIYAYRTKIEFRPIIRNVKEILSEKFNFNWWKDQYIDTKMVVQNMFNKKGVTVAGPKTVYLNEFIDEDLQDLGLTPREMSALTILRNHWGLLKGSEDDVFKKIKEELNRVTVGAEKKAELVKRIDKLKNLIQLDFRDGDFNPAFVVTKNKLDAVKNILDKKDIKEEDFFNALITTGLFENQTVKFLQDTLKSKFITFEDLNTQIRNAVDIEPNRITVKTWNEMFNDKLYLSAYADQNTARFKETDGIDRKDAIRKKAWEIKDKLYSNVEWSLWGNLKRNEEEDYTAKAMFESFIEDKILLEIEGNLTRRGKTRAPKKGYESESGMYVSFFFADFDGEEPEKGYRLQSVEDFILLNFIRREIHNISGQGGMEKYLFKKAKAMMESGNTEEINKIIPMVQSYRDFYRGILQLSVGAPFLDGALNKLRGDDSEMASAPWPFLFNFDEFNDLFYYLMGMKDYGNIDDDTKLRLENFKNKIENGIFKQLDSGKNYNVFKKDTDRLEMQKIVKEEFEPFILQMRYNLGFNTAKNRLDMGQMMSGSIFKILSNRTLFRNFFSKGADAQRLREKYKVFLWRGVYAWTILLFAFVFLPNLVGMILTVPLAITMPYFTVFGLGAIIGGMLISHISRIIFKSDKWFKIGRIFFFGGVLALFIGLGLSIIGTSIIPGSLFTPLSLNFAPIQFILKGLPYLVIYEVLKLSFVTTQNVVKGYISNKKAKKLDLFHFTSYEGAKEGLLEVIFDDTPGIFGKTMGEERLDQFEILINEDLGDIDLLNADDKTKDLKKILSGAIDSKELAQFKAFIKAARERKQTGSLSKKEKEEFYKMLPDTLQTPVAKRRIRNFVNKFYREDIPVVAHDPLDFVSASLSVVAFDEDYMFSFKEMNTPAPITEGVREVATRIGMVARVNAEQWRLLIQELKNKNYINDEQEQSMLGLIESPAKQINIPPKAQQMVQYWISEKLNLSGVNNHTIIKARRPVEYYVQKYNEKRIIDEVNKIAEKEKWDAKKINEEIKIRLEKLDLNKLSAKTADKKVQLMFVYDGPFGDAPTMRGLIKLMADENEAKKKNNIPIGKNFQNYFTYFNYLHRKRETLGRNLTVDDIKSDWELFSKEPKHPDFKIASPKGNFSGWRAMDITLLAVNYGKEHFPIGDFGPKNPIFDKKGFFYRGGKYSSVAAALPYVTGEVHFTVDCDHRSFVEELWYYPNSTRRYVDNPRIGMSIPDIEHAITRDLSAVGKAMADSENAFYRWTQDAKSEMDTPLAYGKMNQRKEAEASLGGMVGETRIAEDALGMVMFIMMGFVNEGMKFLNIEKGWPFSHDNAITPMRKWSGDSGETALENTMQKMLFSPQVPSTWKIGNVAFDGLIFYFKKIYVVRYLKLVFLVAFILPLNPWIGLSMALWASGMFLSQAIGFGNLFNLRYFRLSEGVDRFFDGYGPQWLNNFLAKKIPGSVKYLNNIFYSIKWLNQISGDNISGGVKWFIASGIFIYQLGRMFWYFAQKIVEYEESAGKKGAFRMTAFINTTGKGASLSKETNWIRTYLHHTWAMKTGGLLTLVLLVAGPFHPFLFFLWLPVILVPFSFWMSPFLFITDNFRQSPFPISMNDFVNWIGKKPSLIKFSQTEWKLWLSNGLIFLPGALDYFVNKIGQKKGFEKFSKTEMKLWTFNIFVLVFGAIIPVAIGILYYNGIFIGMVLGFKFLPLATLTIPLIVLWRVFKDIPWLKILWYATLDGLDYLKYLMLGEGQKKIVVAEYGKVLKDYEALINKAKSMGLNDIADVLGAADVKGSLSKILDPKTPVFMLSGTPSRAFKLMLEKYTKLINDISKTEYAANKYVLWEARVVEIIAERWLSMPEIPENEKTNLRDFYLNTLKKIRNYEKGINIDSKEELQKTANELQLIKEFIENDAIFVELFTQLPSFIKSLKDEEQNEFNKKNINLSLIKDLRESIGSTEYNIKLKKVKEAINDMKNVIDRNEKINELKVSNSSFEKYLKEINRENEINQISALINNKSLTDIIEIQKIFKDIKGGYEDNFIKQYFFNILLALAQANSGKEYKDISKLINKLEIINLLNKQLKKINVATDWKEQFEQVLNSTDDNEENKKLLKKLDFVGNKINDIFKDNKNIVTLNEFNQSTVNEYLKSYIYGEIKDKIWEEKLKIINENIFKKLEKSSERFNEIAFIMLKLAAFATKNKDFEDVYGLIEKFFIYLNSFKEEEINYSTLKEMLVFDKTNYLKVLSNATSYIAKINFEKRIRILKEKCISLNLKFILLDELDAEVAKSDIDIKKIETSLKLIEDILTISSLTKDDRIVIIPDYSRFINNLAQIPIINLQNYLEFLNVDKPAMFWLPQVKLADAIKWVPIDILFLNRLENKPLNDLQRKYYPQFISAVYQLKYIGSIFTGQFNDEKVNKYINQLLSQYIDLADAQDEEEFQWALNQMNWLPLEPQAMHYDAVEYLKSYFPVSLIFKIKKYNIGEKFEKILRGKKTSRILRDISKFVVSIPMLDDIYYLRHWFFVFFGPLALGIVLTMNVVPSGLVFGSAALLSMNPVFLFAGTFMLSYIILRPYFSIKTSIVLAVVFGFLGIFILPPAVAVGIDKPLMAVGAGMLALIVNYFGLVKLRWAYLDRKDDIKKLNEKKKLLLKNIGIPYREFLPVLIDQNWRIEKDSKDTLLNAIKNNQPILNAALLTRMEAELFEKGWDDTIKLPLLEMIINTIYFNSKIYDNKNNVQVLDKIKNIISLTLKNNEINKMSLPEAFKIFQVNVVNTINNSSNLEGYNDLMANIDLIIKEIKNILKSSNGEILQSIMEIKTFKDPFASLLDEIWIDVGNARGVLEQINKLDISAFNNFNFTDAIGTIPFEGDISSSKTFEVYFNNLTSNMNPDQKRELWKYVLFRNPDLVLKLAISDADKTELNRLFLNITSSYATNANSFFDNLVSKPELYDTFIALLGETILYNRDVMENILGDRFELLINKNPSDIIKDMKDNLTQEAKASALRNIIEFAYSPKVLKDIVMSPEKLYLLDRKSNIKNRLNVIRNEIQRSSVQVQRMMLNLIKDLKYSRSIVDKFNDDLNKLLASKDEILNSIMKFEQDISKTSKQKISNLENQLMKVRDDINTIQLRIQTEIDTQKTLAEKAKITSELDQKARYATPAYTKISETFKKARSTELAA